MGSFPGGAGRWVRLVTAGDGTEGRKLEDTDVATDYRRPRRATMILALALVTATASCQGTRTATPPAPHPGLGSPTAVSGSPAPLGSAPADPASVHANELGAVPVLMYHQVLPKPAGDYDQTPAQFRDQLEQLYQHGFWTVTAADLVAGNVDVPAGKSPMVLTFDDSTRSQYAEGPGGAVAPTCAVGILLDVARRHGDPRPVATFYVNGAPFGGHPEYLGKLAALGMELGDHTLDHANLRQLDPSGVQRELALGLTVITGEVPGARVTTMALPYGVFPHDHALAVRGSAGATAYDFAAVLLVGSNPAPSPFTASFDPLGVPRIRSGSHRGDQAFTASYWLPRLFDGRITRFVSDGDPTRISFPRALAGRLLARFAARGRAY